MRTVSAEELRAMDAVADKCADELMVGIPVVTAATATAAAVLHRLGRDASGVPGLAGRTWS